MSDNKPLGQGAADPGWWTPARRKAASEHRKAHPQGTRSKEWWAAHPEAKAATGKRLKAVWAAAKAAEEAGG